MAFTHRPGRATVSLLAVQSAVLVVLLTRVYLPGAGR